ncbi:hypothetical protein GL297_06395 [Komagataeibacter sp. FXV2]|nr:hypothetical protein [Komagataeibacter sp. FXV2]
MTAGVSGRCFLKSTPALKLFEKSFTGNLLGVQDLFQVAGPDFRAQPATRKNRARHMKSDAKNA